ncbi:unnamed protein product [Hymenolepis diminuta]|uniref:WD_REPEATS_REGION domain-containing protein n=2 Tax=Hymenolepis diminuta TaxID=6216 RepID=A0A0R3SS19_HYMDI|nr:unnamed protein product [Hymenolepis diminuta]
MYSVDSEVLQALKILQKYNFKEAEAILKKEAGLNDNATAEEFLEFKAEATDDPHLFASAYDEVIKFIDSCTDEHKLELSGLSYPIFVQLYMRLISGGYTTEALALMSKYRIYQDDFYQQDIDSLANITETNHLFTNPIVEIFRASDFSISVASLSHSLFRRFIREKGLSIIQSIVKDQLQIEVVDGPPRTRLQLYARRGAIFGESRRDANTSAVLCGLLKDPAAELDTPDTNDGVNATQDNDQEVTPKKKKKREMTSIGNKTSKYSDSKGQLKSPPLDRIPLPTISETYLDQRRTLHREINQITRGILQSDVNPKTSALLYTICNAQPGESAVSIRRGGVGAVAFSEDMGMLAGGMGSGRIRIWALGAQSLRQMLPPEKLEELDLNDSRIKSKMLHDGDGEPQPSRDLIGHQDAVHGVAFSPDGQLVASASADGTLRLWSTIIWAGALCVWREHITPLWCVDFAPVYGHYMATGGSDRTARLYACDHAPQPLRIFSGHKSDVTSVAFHPNVNYLATGSADRAVRIFDVRSGKCCRTYTGHKGTVQSLAFSPCGRYLASGGWCGAICLWDIGSGSQIGQLGGDTAMFGTKSSGATISSSTSPGEIITGPISCLKFSPDGSKLASGGMEGAVRMWNIGTKLSSEEVNSGPSLLGFYSAAKDESSRGSAVLEGNSFYNVVGGYEVSRKCLQDAFFTRKTTVLAVQFAHPYLLLAAGPFNQI